MCHWPLAGGGDNTAQGRKNSAPVLEREPPEIFMRTFIMRMSCSVRFFGERHSEIVRKAQHVTFEIAQPAQKIMARAADLAT